MKKLFISCPMKGRTEENIRKSMDKMHKMAEIIFEQELEVIPSYIEDNPPENARQGVWYLGKSILLMSKADFFIGVECSDSFNCIEWSNLFKGCDIENRVANSYRIRSAFVKAHEIMPDFNDVKKNWFNHILVDEFVQMKG